jgi:uroporphyrin-III C-methyltransferase
MSRDDRIPFSSLDNIGTVSLVGSGPGSPELLTIAALRKLENADLVISDRLVSKEITNLINCEVKVANKYPGCAEAAQEEIYDWTYNAVKLGKKVVRLKIGDVFLFGRGGEEVLEFRRWGIEAVIIPGISSSYSAPMAANIPLTHRGVSSQVLITTGYGQDSAVVDIPDYAPDRTIVLLMAVGRITEIADTMIRKGYSPTTPVIIAEKATTPSQRIIRGVLENIGDVAKATNAVPPATIVIGDVVNVLREDDGVSGLVY